MKYELRSIGLWSFIKVSVFVNLIFGFIFGIFYAFMLSAFMSMFSSLGMIPMEEFDGGEMSFIGLIIVVPIMSSIGGAVFGTLGGAILVLIYNLVVKVVGGLEFEFRDTQPQPMTAYTASPPPPSMPPPAQTTAPPPPPPSSEPPSPYTPPPPPPPDGENNPPQA